ncbi:MAG: efflux RND transporter periplasmic adaptor subunit [Spirochaetaceae bacterium]|nr:MAG: efflux RND transporter periplasmic adaptor subunit [Spirochaetaceae bacterium]
MKKGVRITIILVVVAAIVVVGGYLGYTRFTGQGDEGPGAGFLFFRPGSGGRRPGGRDPGGAEGNPEETFSVPVAVTTARRENARETLTLYGSVFAEKEVGILTTVTGKITAIQVEEGDIVQKDQVLAVIDRDQAGLKFAPVEVKSTIAGVVKSVLTQEGATANPGVPLFQVVVMDVVDVVVDVPEKRIGQVRVGLPVEISVISYPDRLFYGTIDRLKPVVDPDSRSLETRIRVTNRGYQLKPGMFAEASIILRQRENAVTVPLAALVNKDGQRVAFIIEQDVAREVKPEISFVEGERAVVDSGIAEGDLVVVIGQQSLSGGDAVTVVEVKE